MHKLTRVLQVTLLVAMMLALLPAFNQARADYEPKRVYFEKTGYWVAGIFLDYYNTRGGLDAFGYPRSNQFMEDGRIVQYFQRGRFEWWPENPSAYMVQLALLADVFYGPGAPPIPASQIPSANDPNIRYYKETGHTLAHAFKTYFDRNGGLDMFGYPTTEQYMENGFIVQRFQRVRFEYHPENPEPYKVQLGLLGDQLLQAQGRIDDPAAKPVGLRYTPVAGLLSPAASPAPAPAPAPAPQPSGNQWAIAEFRQLTPCENKGMHNLFIEAYNADGSPANGVPVILQVVGTDTKIQVITGDKGPGKAEINIWKGMNNNIAFVASGSSDVTPNFTTEIWQDVMCEQGGGGNTTFHYSYKVVFKKTS